jgi:hypothetical protein
MAPRPRATFIGPGIHGTGSARKLAVVSEAHVLELGRFSTRNNFYRQVLRRVFVLTYSVEKISWRKLRNFCEIAVFWEANQISPFSRLTRA